jgi:hypothetical protein
MLRRIFETKRSEIIRGSRKLHNDELHSFYYSPSIIRIIQSRRIKWKRHVASIEIRGLCVGFSLVRERTIPTEQHSLVDEVKANFLQIEGVVC